MVTSKIIKNKSVQAGASTLVPSKTVPTPVVLPSVTKVDPKLVIKPTFNTATKPVAKSTAKPTSKAKKIKPAKVKKQKLVRDSFTIPKTEYSVLEDLKRRAGKLARPVKKSELLRAGIKALTALSDAVFLAALKAVPAIKTGRPAKDN